MSNGAAKVSGENPKGNPERLSLRETLAKYGAAALVVHASVYVVTFSTALGAVGFASDRLDWVLESASAAVGMDISTAGPLLAAYLITTATGPFRGIITVFAAPYTARALSKSTLWAKYFPINLS